MATCELDQVLDSVDVSGERNEIAVEVDRPGIVDDQRDFGRQFVIDVLCQAELCSAKVRMYELNPSLERRG